MKLKRFNLKLLFTAIVMFAMIACVGMPVYADQTSSLIVEFSGKDATYTDLWSVEKNIQPGDLMFSDRAFLIKTLPDKYKGMDWIKVSNDSKKSTKDVLATFKAGQNIDVYIAYDSRITAKADWLKNYQDTGDALVDNGETPLTYVLLKKSFNKDETITLGNNGSSSGCCSYIVLVSAQSTTTAVTTQAPVVDEKKTTSFKTAIFQLNNPKVLVDGVEKFWTSDQKTSVATFDNSIYFPIESAKDLFGDTLDLSSTQKDSKTLDGKAYLPLRTTFEKSNCVVAWDAETKTIIITSGKTSNVASVTWKAILSQPTWWYGSDEAIRIANNVVYYQRNSGGWVKNTDMDKVMTSQEIEQLLKDKGKNDATIDNGSTATQVQYLAKVYSATKIQRFKDSFYKAIDALLLAQYDNGGWPQYLTDTSGYRAQITYNDDAIVNILKIMDGMSKKAEPYAFVSDDYVTKATQATQKGVDCILKTQLVVQGVKTGWCQQYDQITMKPATARSYELPSVSGSESVKIVRYLMSIENPSAEIIDAVRCAVTWFEKVKLTGIVVKDVADPSVEGRKNRIVVEDPAASPIWARFYDLDTNMPFFVGRDGIKKETFAEIELERRLGYSYYGNWPQKLIDTEYPAWEAKIKK